MKTFVLVISMWGNDGAGTDHYIGQMAMQTPMTQEICEKFIGDDNWSYSYDNEYYKLVPQCYPSDCSGKEKCEQ